MAQSPIPLLAATLLILFTAGCGGGGGAGSPAGSASSSGSAANGASGSAGTGASGSGGSTTGSPATTLNTLLGKPARVLIGLGAGNTLDQIKTQGIQPDIFDSYLVGVGAGSWTTWNSPSGAYLTLTAQQAAAAGAVPMFTLYQMAQNGDGNLSGLGDSLFMGNYWAQARLMFQLLGSSGGPALVNLEPDFWGYVWQQAPAHDPTRLPAVVSPQAECRSLPDTAAGVAACLLTLARLYAPKALIGFPPSFWGTPAATIALEMQALGAQNADFIVAQTSDRDAGCAELAAPPAECQGRTGPFYWDEANLASPNFLESQNEISTYRAAIGRPLPILWWQTPMGVPSTTPGGSTQHFRDNHVDYMLKNPQQYGDIHSFAMVFSSGASSQTTINTDGGQFRTLFSQYLASGGAIVR